MSTTCRSNGKPTRQVVPSSGSMLAVRWLMRTITPTKVFRRLSSKAIFSPQRKSLRPARGAGGSSGSGAGRERRTHARRTDWPPAHSAPLRPGRQADHAVPASARSTVRRLVSSTGLRTRTTEPRMLISMLPTGARVVAVGGAGSGTGESEQVGAGSTTVTGTTPGHENPWQRRMPTTADASASS